MVSSEKKSKKEKQEEAKKKIKGLYDLLKKANETYEGIDDIQQKIKEELDKIVQEYKNDLPPKVRDALDKAINISNQISEANSAFNLVGPYLKDAIHGFGNPLLLSLIVVVVVVAATATAAAVYNYELVDVTISNRECPPTPLTQGFISIPSVNTDSSTTISVPPMKVNVGATPNVVTFSSAGQSVQEPLPSGVKDATFDGQDVLGKTISIDLGSQKSHQLVISCTS